MQYSYWTAPFLVTWLGCRRQVAAEVASSWQLSRLPWQRPMLPLLLSLILLLDQFWDQKQHAGTGQVAAPNPGGLLHRQQQPTATMPAGGQEGLLEGPVRRACTADCWLAGQQHDAQVTSAGERGVRQGAAPSGSRSHLAAAVRGRISGGGKL